MLNLDSFDGFLPTAGTPAEGYPWAARERGQQPGLEDELGPFPFPCTARVPAERG